MIGWLTYIPLALEGQWHGAAAVALVLTGAVIFIGTIYVLLTAIYGWRQAFHVTMVALMAFMIILAATWVFGIPGTIPGTGPRGTEPSWVMFLADSEQGQEFSRETGSFNEFARAAEAAIARREAQNAEIDRRNKAKPAGQELEPPVTTCGARASAGGWLEACVDDRAPGGINVSGELDSIKNTLRPALAGFFQRQKTGSSKPADYEFDVPGVTGQDPAVPDAVVGLYPNGKVLQLDPTAATNWLIQQPAVREITPEQASKRLLVGIRIPRTDKHPAITVFGFYDKGRVFEPAAIFLAVSIALFVFHTWMLARFERRQKEREAELTRPVAERVPAGAPS